MMKYVLLSITCIFILWNCTPKPSPIEYGKDQCHYCKMIISDKRFGAELVSKKGKVFKFDAIECLIPTMKTKGESEFAYKLVSNYLAPGKLLDVEQAHYFQSPDIPSPMGANLSAYGSLVALSSMQKKHKGKTFTWKKLITEENVIPND